MEANERKFWAILVNDLHIDKETIEDFKVNWDELLDVAERCKVNYICIGGDLFTTRASQTLSVLLTVRDSLQRAINRGFNVRIVNGNHDKVDQESLCGYCNLYSGMFNVKVSSSDRPILIGMEKVLLCMMDYYPEKGGFVEHLEIAKEAVKHLEITKESDKKNDVGRKVILYIHEGINGGLAKMSETELSPDVFDDTWDEILVGHYHNRKHIQGTKIQYIGSSRQHGFGEDENKGYTLVDTEGNTHFVKNEANMRYVTLDYEFDTSVDDIRPEVDKYIENGYKVRLRINCTPSQAASIQKEKYLELGITKLDLSQKTEGVGESSSHDIVEKYDKNGLIENYKKYCDSASVENPELGIEYLNKIDSYVGD